MIPLSILDLAPVTEGSDAAPVLRQHARPGAARRAAGLPPLLAGRTPQHAGHRQRGDGGADRPRRRRHRPRIRVGAGGIMLPNHAPLQVAEQFGTLASLYPGRIDLGLGRAPGTDQAATRALRRYYARRRRVPARRGGAAAVLRAGRSRASRCARCRARARRARPGSSARACSARSSPRRSACRTRSPRTSRPTLLEQALAIYRARVPPVGAAAAAARDAGAERGRRRHRRGSAAPVHHAAARLRQPASWPARAGAATGR